MKVASVNTLTVPGKEKRMGAGRPGMTKTWKKAYVQLAADSKTIELRRYGLINGRSVTRHVYQNFKPTTPSRRQMTVSGFDGIDKKAKPEPA